MIMTYSNWLLLQEIFESDVHIISYPLWCNTRAEKKEEKQQQNTHKERQNTQIRLFALMFFSSLPAHQSPPKMIVSVSLSFHLFVVFFFHPCPFSFLDCVKVCVCVKKNVKRAWSYVKYGAGAKTLPRRNACIDAAKLSHQGKRSWANGQFRNEQYPSFYIFPIASFFSPLLTRSFLLTPSSSSPTQP